MEKIENFLSRHGMLIIILIFLVVLAGQCRNGSRFRAIERTQKEMKASFEKTDSATLVKIGETNSRMDVMVDKLDSTLISNGAVISANRQTSDAINGKKQNIIIKMDK